MQLRRQESDIFSLKNKNVTDLLPIPYVNKFAAARLGLKSTTSGICLNWTYKNYTSDLFIQI